MKRVALAAILIAVTGCSPAPTPSEATRSFDDPVAETSADGFTLTLAVEDAQVAAGEEIHPSAALGHDRADDVALTGSSSGIVFFSVTRIEDGLTSGPPAHHDDCVPQVVPAGPPLPIPFSKSGGFAPEDPGAEFLEIYFRDPDLTLPAGTWRIDAVTYAWIGDECSGEPLDLATSVEVVVSE